MNKLADRLMKLNKSQIELLAPAGSFESLRAAIDAGANSVYFGIEHLNMRSRSSNNFTLNDLDTICGNCKDTGLKTYLTLNTILYDHDIKLMKTIVERAKESGVRAIIASDHAVMAYCSSLNMPVHISTQANITNVETVAFYARYADAMVLSRELSLRQVKDIARQIEREKITGPGGKLIQIEVFAHGALCMAVSGKCYLSLHTYNASANRGVCLQNCRKEYIVKSKDDEVELAIDNEYIMSAKDLCTIGFLDKIVAAGVNILKIEGRGRSADYVDVTVRCYREALDAIDAGEYTSDRISDWTNRLSTVYNRGFWDGYYLGRTLGEWNDTYGSRATEKKIFLGKNTNYFSNLSVGEFHMEAQELCVGDKILIMGPVSGITRLIVEELRVDDKTVNNVQKGDEFSIKLPGPVRRSDKLYKIVEAK